MKTNVLITGGAGFIGSNFVYLVLKRRPDWRVTVLDALTYAGNLSNLEAAFDDERFRFIKADLEDEQAVRELFERERYSSVVHFAAESHVDRSIAGPGAFVRTNILGTYNLLEAARNTWGDERDRLFVHVSTDEVFGSLGADGLFSEESPYRPNSPYSASKAASDHLARAYFHTYGMPVIITNCSNNYGPFQFPEKLIPLMVTNCLQGKELPVYGDGMNVRDWLYVEDHCSALEAVIEKGRPGETYNIGGNSERTNIELVRGICAIMDRLHPDGAPHDRLIRFVTDRPGHDLRYAIDSSKIQNELGWSPAFSFEKALEATVQWYVDEESWWRRILSGEYRENPELERRIQA